MKILINENIQGKKWKALIEKSQYASPFQTLEYYDLFNAVEGLKAEVYAVEENSDIIALCVITFQKERAITGYFSRRAIIYGGPVLKNHDETVLDFLLTYISNEFRNRAIFVEIRNLNDYSTLSDVFEKNRWQYIPFQNFIIDCTDIEGPYNKLGQNRKRQIKKAINSGVEVREAENKDEVLEYYNILQRLYCDKIKKPLFPKQFFEEFFDRNLGKYLLVFHKNKIIGGILCPILDGSCLYELYICGLDEEYKDQYPSVMATWGAIEFGKKNHIPIFDFMGAGRKGHDYGVREFKARFGGKLVEYGRYIKINNPLLYKIGVLALRLKQMNKK